MLSTVILTKNEEEHIEKAIKSVSFSDEIIVIDDESTDETVKIAKKLGATVYARALENDFSSQRNFGMDKATGDWILFLDADETISPELKTEITHTLKNDIHHNLFFIKRRDEFWGKILKHGELKTAYTNGFVRLMKKGSGLWNGSVHETFITSQNVGRLKNFINHTPHKNITEFIQSVNFYSTLRAKELFKLGKRTNIFEIMFLPFSKFIYTYFLKGGYADSAPGFVYSFLMSFHSFLVRAKMYQYEHIDS